MSEIFSVKQEAVGQVDVMAPWFFKHKEDLKMLAIRHLGGKIYYFDNDGICRTIEDKTIKRQIAGLNCQIKGVVYDRQKNQLFVGHFCNYNTWRNAASRIKEGDTIDRFLDYYAHPVVVSRAPTMPKPIPKIEDGLDYLITRIDKPDYCREPENLNKKTFDFIVVRVFLVTENAFPGRNQYIKENLKGICERAAGRIEKDYQFARFGVPINVLKLSSAKLIRHGSYLELIFELKDR